MLNDRPTEQSVNRYVDYVAPAAFVQDATWCYPVTKCPERGTIVYPYRRVKCQVQPSAETFCRQLRVWLPRQIQVLADVCIVASECERPLHPDLALFMKDRPDICIDIEIDEPYTDKYKPIHYLTCGDDYRDAMLNRHGWTVVRFAESQVRCEPEQCADYLQRLAEALCGELSFRDDSKPARVKRWTRTEAQKMAAGGIGCPCTDSGQPPLQAFNAYEQQCKQQVKPLERSADILQKMETFTDAGRYEQDQFIDFEPIEHIYTYNGRQRMLSVSGVAGYFFESFDALRAAGMRERRHGIPVADSLDEWDRIGRLASEVGTFVHAQTENYFKDGTFENVCSVCHGDDTEEVSVERERQHFLNFVKDYQITPYRQEWPVYDINLNIAGTIDMICQEADGTFTIYDWKRSGKVVNPQGQPIVEAFAGKRSMNGINLPDTPFYHYCIQQNLYRYMLETHYGIRIKKMNLVVLYPEYTDYVVVEVPKMDELVEQIVAVCHEKDLGHRLLK